MKKLFTSKWIFIPALLIGVVVVNLLIKNRAQPDILPLTELSKSVYTLKAPVVELVTLVNSSGTVNPGRVWRGIAEVSGQIVNMHLMLKNGSIIKKGDILINIDPTDYELAIAQANANIKVNEAQLLELDVQKQNTQTLIEIEKNSLKISKNEVNRKKRLFKDKSISRADYDKEVKNHLNQKKSYASLDNTLALFPVQKDRINAELKKLNVQLETAKRNLKRTTIRMPFTGRVAEMNIEQGQFVKQGELLTVIDGMEKAEITVQVPMSSMSYLMRTNTGKIFNAAGKVRQNNHFGITAVVKLTLNGNTMRWPGAISRISETFDVKTRTIGVIVEVKDPYKNIIPGKRPPLMKGLYVSVELRGQPQANRLVVPRSAVYNSTLNIVNDQNRLETRTITISQISNDYAVVASGLSQGEQVVISDLVPAIEGMLLNPIDDPRTRNLLMASASLSQSSKTSGEIARTTDKTDASTNQTSQGVSQ